MSVPPYDPQTHALQAGAQQPRVDVVGSGVFCLRTTS